MFNFYLLGGEEWMAKVKALVDGFLGKFISRTLFVFLMFTGFFLFGKIQEEHYYEITMVYIGGRKILDGVAMGLAHLKKGKKEEDEEGVVS